MQAGALRQAERPVRIAIRHLIMSYLIPFAALFLVGLLLAAARGSTLNYGNKILDIAPTSYWSFYVC
jgi:hypothetical protein